MKEKTKAKTYEFIFMNLDGSVFIYKEVIGKTLRNFIVTENSEFECLEPLRLYNQIMRDLEIEVIGEI